jgi:hypothetical protein
MWHALWRRLIACEFLHLSSLISRGAGLLAGYVGIRADAFMLRSATRQMRTHLDVYKTGPIKISGPIADVTELETFSDA